MLKNKIPLLIVLLLGIGLVHLKCETKKNKISKRTTMQTPEINKTAEDWKKVLTDEEYYVLREAGTERPFTGKYTDTKADGNYYCKACGNLLFTAETKYHSGCGWPAFYDNAGNSAVLTRSDYSHNMNRIEVICKKCHSHLGHLFEDGPIDKTGLRYCINSICLDFKQDSIAK